MLPWCRALYHRRSLGMIPVTAYRGVANRGPGALMNCPTFLPMGDNFCLIQVVKTRESKESARNKSFRVLCTPISGPRLTVESPLIQRKSIGVNYLTRDLRKFIAKTSPTLLAYSGFAWRLALQTLLLVSMLVSTKDCYIHLYL